MSSDKSTEQPSEEMIILHKILDTLADLREIVEKHERETQAVIPTEVKEEKKQTTASSECKEKKDAPKRKHDEVDNPETRDATKAPKEKDYRVAQIDAFCEQFPKLFVNQYKFAATVAKLDAKFNEIVLRLYLGAHCFNTCLLRYHGPSKEKDLQMILMCRELAKRYTRWAMDEAKKHEEELKEILGVFAPCSSAADTLLTLYYDPTYSSKGSDFYESAAEMRRIFSQIACSQTEEVNKFVQEHHMNNYAKRLDAISLSAYFFESSYKIESLMELSVELLEMKWKEHLDRTTPLKECLFDSLNPLYCMLIELKRMRRLT